MKKIFLGIFAVVFFNLSVSTGQPVSLIAVPMKAVVVEHPTLPLHDNQLIGDDQDMARQLSGRKGKSTSVKKLGFRDRMVMRIMSKKIRKQAARQGDELSEADRMAKSSRTLGIIALVLAVIPFYTILAAIPLGIIAISRASKARKMGSTRKTGKGMGIAALVIAGLWIIFAFFYLLLVGEAFLLALFGA